MDNIDTFHPNTLSLPSFEQRKREIYRISPNFTLTKEINVNVVVSPNTVTAPDTTLNISYSSYSPAFTIYPNPIPQILPGKNNEIPQITAQFQGKPAFDWLALDNIKAVCNDHYIIIKTPLDTLHLWTALQLPDGNYAPNEKIFVTGCENPEKELQEFIQNKHSEIEFQGGIFPCVLEMPHWYPITL